MLERPTQPDFAAFFQGYVDHVPDGDVLQQLDRQGRHVEALLARMDERQGDFAYAPGKWTVKRLVQHVVDGERLFAYRALCVARGDTTDLPAFDEDRYAAHDGSERRSIASLREEHAAVRASTLALFRGFDEAAWARRGSANGHGIAVAALPWIAAGHELHHLRVLQERYGITGAAAIGSPSGFGMELYSEMRGRGLLHVLTQRLDYAAIQRLKAADREGVVALFPNGQYAFRQALRNDSARDVARRLEDERRKGEMAMLALMFALT